MGIRLNNIISSLLTIALCVGLAPASAFAAIGEDDLSSVEQKPIIDETFPNEEEDSEQPNVQGEDELPMDEVIEPSIPSDPIENEDLAVSEEDPDEDDDAIVDEPIVEDRMSSAKVDITQTDDQKMRGAFSVVVSGLPSTGIAFVEAPTWSEANGQDDLEWYRLTSWQGVWTRELPCLTPNRQPGTYLTHVYVTTSQGNRVFIGGASANITLAPSSVKASVNAPETWFSVSASGGYASMADAVQFAVWSDAGGQDDLRWYSSTKRGAAWGNDIPVSLHATAGNYQVHAYALKGTQRSFVGGATFKVSAPTGKVKISQTDDQKMRGAFSVTLSGVNSPSGVAYADAPTWSEANGQDDLEWYRLTSWQGVWTRELPCLTPNRQPGTYLTHVYVTTSQGNRVFIGGASANITLAPSSVKASVNAPETWFSVSASGGYASMADAVQFAVWSDAGGQDDLRWYSSTKRGAAWGNDIPVSLHATAGNYQVHAYALKGTQRSFVGGATFKVSAPTGKVELLSTDTNVYRLRVSDVHAPSGISAISDGAWAVVDGQDDLVWHQANGSAATGWTVIVSATEHRAQDGIYENHIYVACQNGVRACIGGCKAAMTVYNCPFVIGGMGSGKRTIGVRKALSTQEMSFAVWSEANGQDDLVWYPAQRVSADTWQADIDCRRLRDSGTVAAHAYRYGGTFTTSLTFEVSRDDVSLSGDPELDAILRNIIANHGTDLRSLYDYVASYPYISGSKYPAGDWTVPFAIEMYRNGGGNCYRYAALFEWLAKAAGYNAKAIAGHALNRYGGWNAHGWVEVYINGATYVCDPQSTHAIAGRNFYMVTYENAPLTYRPW